MQGQGIIKSLGLAQTADFSGLVQQNIQSIQSLSQQEVASQNRLAEQQIQDTKSLTDLQISGAKNIVESRVKNQAVLMQEAAKKKKERDDAVKSLLDEASGVDMTGARQNDMVGLTQQYNSLVEFVTENVDQIYNPADDPQKYSEYKSNLNELTKYAQMSKQRQAFVNELIGDLADKEQYQQRAVENKELIQKVQNTPMFKEDGSFNEEFTTVGNTKLKSGVGFVDAAANFAKGFKTEEGQLYATTVNGEKVLVTDSGQLSRQKLEDFAVQFLSSTNGTLAMGERYSRDKAFSLLTEEEKQQAVDDFVNVMIPYLDSEISAKFFPDESSGGGGSYDTPLRLDYVPYVLGKTSLGLSENSEYSGAQTVVVKLNNGSEAIMMVNKSRNEEGELTDANALHLGNIVVDENGEKRISATAIAPELLPDDFRSAYTYKKPEVAASQILSDINTLAPSAKSKINVENILKKYNASDLPSVLESQLNTYIKEKGWGAFVNESQLLDGSTSNQKVEFALGGSDPVETSLDVLNDEMTKAFVDVQQTKDTGNITINVGQNTYSFAIEWSGNAAFKVFDASGRVVLSEKSAIGDPQYASKMLYNKIYNQIANKAIYSGRYDFQVPLSVGGASTNEASDSGTGDDEMYN